MHMFFNANFKGTKCLLGKGIHSAKSIYSHEEEIHERSNGRNTSNTGRSLSGTVNNFEKKCEGSVGIILNSITLPITQGPTYLFYGFKIEVIFVKAMQPIFAWSFSYKIRPAYNF